MTTTTTKRDPITALAAHQARRVEKLRAALEASKCRYTGSNASRQKHLHALYCEARRALHAIENAQELGR